MVGRWGGDGSGYLNVCRGGGRTAAARVAALPRRLRPRPHDLVAHRRRRALLLQARGAHGRCLAVQRRLLRRQRRDGALQRSGLGLLLLAQEPARADGWRGVWAKPKLLPQSCRARARVMRNAPHVGQLQPQRVRLLIDGTPLLHEVELRWAGGRRRVGDEAGRARGSGARRAGWQRRAHALRCLRGATHRFLHERVVVVLHGLLELLQVDDARERLLHARAVRFHEVLQRVALRHACGGKQLISARAGAVRWVATSSRARVARPTRVWRTPSTHGRAVRPPLHECRALTWSGSSA